MRFSTWYVFARVAAVATGALHALLFPRPCTLVAPAFAFCGKHTNISAVAARAVSIAVDVLVSAGGKSAVSARIT